MPIDINPHRINIPSSAVNRAPQQRREQAQRQQENVAPVVPKRAHLNIVPEPESLATLIRSAVAALRQGAVWDRGTMLNLLV